MTSQRRTFTRESPEQRKASLVRAALKLIAQSGIQAASVRSIAAEADVTLGLIRHYFASKEELINAAYQHHMSEMTSLTMAYRGNETDGPAIVRLAAVVRASLSPPVMQPDAVALWASFLTQLQEDLRMQETHLRTYRDFRDQLEALIGVALAEDGRKPSPARLRHLSVACNAVIDGLWMEGGALPDEFAQGELVSIGLESVGNIIGLDLKQGVVNERNLDHAAPGTAWRG